jgi:hypothetical protein
MFTQCLVDERIARMADVASPARMGEVLFTRREIREYTGWAQSRVKRYLKQLVEMEFLAAVSGRFGRTYQYTLVPEAIRSSDLVSTWPPLRICASDWKRNGSEPGRSRNGEIEYG